MTKASTRRKVRNAVEKMSPERQAALEAELKLANDAVGRALPGAADFVYGQMYGNYPLLGRK